MVWKSHGFKTTKKILYRPTVPAVCAVFYMLSKTESAGLCAVKSAQVTRLKYFQVVHKLFVSSSFHPLSLSIKTETHLPAICFSVEINTIWLAAEADNTAN